MWKVLRLEEYKFSFAHFCSWVFLKLFALSIKKKKKNPGVPFYVLSKNT